MTVSFDTFQTNDTSGLNTSNLSVPITVAAQANRLVLAIFHSDSVAVDTDQLFVSWGNTTVGSDSFTEIATSILQPNIGMFYLLNPDTAAHTVRFEYRSTGGTGLSARGTVVSLYGVHQTTPTDTLIVSTGVGSTAGVTDTHDATIDTNGLVLDAWTAGASDMQMEDTTATQTVLYNDTAAGITIAGVSYEVPVTSPVPMTWQFTDPSTASVFGWVHMTVGILPAPTVILSTVDQALETDLSQAMTVLKTLAVAQNTETDLAQAISALKTLLLVQTTETDLAQEITVPGIFATVNQVVETDFVGAITPLKTLAVSLATETDLAQAISLNPIARLVSQVTETDLAQAIAIVYEGGGGVVITQNHMVLSGDMQLVVALPGPGGKLCWKHGDLRS